MQPLSPNPSNADDGATGALHPQSSPAWDHILSNKVAIRRSDGARLLIRTTSDRYGWHACRELLRLAHSAGYTAGYGERLLCNAARDAHQAGTPMDTFVPSLDLLRTNWTGYLQQQAGQWTLRWQHHPGEHRLWALPVNRQDGTPGVKTDWLAAQDRRDAMNTVLTGVCEQAGFWLDAYFLDAAASIAAGTVTAWADTGYQLAAYTALLDVFDDTIGELRDTIRSSTTGDIQPLAFAVQQLDSVLAEQAAAQTTHSRLLETFTSHSCSLEQTGAIGRYTPQSGNAAAQ